MVAVWTTVIGLLRTHDLTWPAQLRNIPGLAAPGVPALGPRALIASVAFSVLLKGAGQGGKDSGRVIAGHQVAAGAEVGLAVRKAASQLARGGDGDLWVLLAVPQVDRGGHLLQAEAPRTAVPEQIGGHDRGPCR